MLYRLKYVSDTYNYFDANDNLVADGEMKKDFSKQEDQIFNILEHWHYSYWHFIEPCFNAAEVLNKTRFNAWEEKVLQNGTKRYNDSMVYYVLIDEYMEDNAQILVEKYPQILKFQTDSSPSVRCGFAYFTEHLERQQALKILQAMRGNGQDFSVNNCIDKSIETFTPHPSS